MAERPDAESRTGRNAKAERAAKQRVVAAVEALGARASEARREAEAFARAMEEVTRNTDGHLRSLTGWDPATPHETVEMRVMGVPGMPDVSAEPVPVVVHPSDKCTGRPCVIHHPSEHHMRDLPLLWNAEQKTMYRICEHDELHPDFDHLAYTAMRFGDDLADLQSQHTCCGFDCCGREFI